MGKNELEIYFYLKDHTDLNHPIKVGDLKKKLGDCLEPFFSITVFSENKCKKMLA